jgi:putative ABC transport system substrate-binding protein
VKRRELMLLLGAAMTAARTLRAQQKAMPVIGFLNTASLGANAPYVAAFRQGLRETGYVVGQNLAINTAGRREAMMNCPLWPPTSSAARST